MGSLGLRSGFNFLNLDKTHSSPNSNLPKQILDEVLRVYDQMKVNTFYYELDSISGLNRIKPDKLLDAVGIKEGMEIDPSQFSRLFKYLKSYPWIEEYEIQKFIYPKRIKINVKEAVPAYVIEYAGDSWLMSKRGVLIEPLSKIKNPEVVLEASNLPRLYDQDGDQQSAERTTLLSTSQRLKTAVTMLEYFDLSGGLPFTFSTVRILPYGQLKLDVLDGVPADEVIINAHSLSEAKVKIAQIKAIIKDLEQRQEKAHRIDLSFKGQAIVK